MAAEAAGRGIGTRAKEIEQDRYEQMYGLKKDGSSSRLRKILAGIAEGADSFTRGFQGRTSRASIARDDAEKAYQLETQALGADATNSRTFAGNEARAYSDLQKLKQAKELGIAKNAAMIRISEIAAGPKQDMAKAAIMRAETAQEVAEVMNRLTEEKIGLVAAQAATTGKSKDLNDTEALYSMDPDKRKSFLEIMRDRAGQKANAEALGRGPRTSSTSGFSWMKSGTDPITGRDTFTQMPRSSTTTSGFDATRSPFFQPGSGPTSRTNAAPTPVQFNAPPQGPVPDPPAQATSATKTPDFRPTPGPQIPKEWGSQPNAQFPGYVTRVMPGLTKEQQTALTAAATSSQQSTALTSNLIDLAFKRSIADPTNFELNRYTGPTGGVNRLISSVTDKVPPALGMSLTGLNQWRNDYVKAQTGAARSMREFEYLKEQFPEVGAFTAQGPKQTMQKAAILHFVSNVMNWKTMRSMTNPQAPGYIDFTDAIRTRLEEIDRALPAFQDAIRQGKMTSAQARQRMKDLMNTSKFITDEIQKSGKWKTVDLVKGK